MRIEEAADDSVARAATPFATTHWSVILAAADSQCQESAAALEKLARTYWYPLYAFSRKQGHSRPDAEDLVQEFFARLLEKRYVAMANPARGKFRSFLLTALRHFLANEWDRKTAAKRGGRHQLLSWDELSPECRYAAAAGTSMSPEQLFDQTWALSVLASVRDRLRSETAPRRTIDRFELLEQFLPGARNGLSYAELGKRWGVKEVTVRAEVHQLRKRYAVLLRETVADLVSHPNEVDDELRALIAAVAH